MSNDFTTMNNPGFLYRAALLRPFPEWVENSPMPQKEEFEKKASTAFADPARRLLPICTKTAAFHSALNILAHPDNFDTDALGRVKEACAHYGIEQDILPYIDLFVEELEKSASDSEAPEGRFAIDDFVADEHYRLLPINNSDEVSESARDLAKMAADNRIHLLMLVPAAREIVKAAKDHGVTRLPDIVARYGYERHPDAEKSAKLIAGRENLCRDESLRPVLASNYAEALAQVETDPDGAMTKIAGIDDAAGIRVSHRQFSPVVNPYDIVFCGVLESEVEKCARQNVVVRDILIPLDEISKIDSTAAAFKLSKGAAESFSRLRDTDDARHLSLDIDTWDERDQRTLLRLAVDHA